MEELLKDLREYWLVSERTTEELSPIDCNRILERALVLLEAAVRESSAVITRDSLPTVMAEELPLVLLFQNLIGNALKYRRLEEPPHVHVSAEQCNDTWSFAIRDNGIGIEAQHLQKIFAPFKRLHGRELPGTGIGLALCKKIVERYRGRIWVESESGKGSTFRFTIPSNENRQLYEHV